MDVHTVENGKVNGNGHGVPTSTLSTTPFSASRKVYVSGANEGARVPMREISPTPTKSMSCGAPTPNEPVTVYDTSGPFTDPAVSMRCSPKAKARPTRRPAFDVAPTGGRAC